jgi:AcrR family transcriptional regulator
MPKETSFNLDQDKKQKIIEAAMNEFTDNELHKARVSNIIKEANIPRGSFYQYFEDIDDLYYHIIDSTFNQIFDEGYKYSEITNDIFEFTRLTFEVDYRGYSDKNKHKFMRNVFRSIGTNVEYIEHHNNLRKDYISKILSRMNLTNIRISSQKELIRLYEFLQHIKRMVIQGAFMRNQTFAEAKEVLEWHLDILENGILKEDINE